MSEQSFPEKFTASVISQSVNFSDALKQMPYDVAVVVDDADNIVGTVNRTQITFKVKSGELDYSASVCEIMEPQDSLTGSSDRQELQDDTFYIFIYKIVKRQVQKKVFNENNHDLFINKVFNHVRKRINEGKYDSCSHQMNFSHWLRTVVNNKIIDELRKLPKPEAMDEFREKQQLQVHSNAVNPLRTVNKGDVMAIIVKAIAKLPEKQKQALLMSIENPDLAGSEQAERLGMTVNAFHLNLNRSRDKLQKILTEYAPETVSVIKELRNKPAKDG